MVAGTQLSQRLMSTFLVELEEHAREIERDVLALERGEGAPDQIYITLFRSAHSLKGAARVIGLDAIETACHRFEEIVQGLRDGKLVANTSLFQLLLSAADALSATGRLLAEKRETFGAPLLTLLPRLAAAAESLPESQPVAAAREEPVQLATTAAAPSKPQDVTLRVAAAKLDALLAQDGELLVARRRAASHAETLEKLLLRVRDAQREGSAAFALREIVRELSSFSGQVTSDAKALDQAAGKLSEEIRQVRMLPFAQACEGLDRLVRDLTSGGGKQVSFSVSGGEIGIDRSILEGLRDPLLHLVRNAVDHGIEPKDIRKAAGKNVAGRVSVSASLSGPQVIVKVRDDGRGIDTGAVAAQARRRGLAPKAPGHEHDAIFEPGFTTLSSVSTISGRGVGLDVVKSQIEDMRGAISVANEPGKGAEFTILLPLTLTSVRGLLIGCGGQVFALDSTMVRGLRRVLPGNVRSVEGHAVLVGEGEPLPFASLSALIGIGAVIPREDEPMHVVLLGAGKTEAAIAVDALYDEDDLTVRNLGHRFGRLTNVSGGTILPDGRVALILHAADLIAGALEGKAISLSPPSQPVCETKKRLVIAEDSMTTRTLIKAILENAGYEVEAAADGAQAWRLLEANGADLVVADVEMPNMDGFQLTQTIRSSKRHSDIPVILLTALETDRDKARGLSAGANAYLLKSAFDQRDLLAAIGEMV
ncbi:MAG TPA: response regulator [Rhizomicrobium sp.]|jgi:two-component system chemotaxis sensor kinase CheA